MANLQSIAAQFSVSVSAVIAAVQSAGLVVLPDYSDDQIVVIGQHLTGSAAPAPSAQPANAPVGDAQSVDPSGDIAFVGNAGAVANNIAVQQQTAIANQIVNAVVDNGRVAGHEFATHIYNAAWSAFADGMNQQLAALQQTGDARPDAVPTGLYQRPQFAPAPQPQLSAQTRQQLFLDQGDPD